MIKQKITSFVCAMLAAVTLLMCVSCDFSTQVISDAEKPSAVLNNFFTELKAENYEICDRYLADNATFVLNNTSGYDFTEELMKLEIKYMQYELLGDTVFDGIYATQQVQISAPDIEYMTREMKQSIGSIEYAYLADKEEAVFDKENSKHVSDVISIALEKYFEKEQQPKMLDSQVIVGFKYQDGAWKIEVDDILVAAIFGGKVDE